jgi:hypothetical protein
MISSHRSQRQEEVKSGVYLHFLAAVALKETCGRTIFVAISIRINKFHLDKAVQSRSQNFNEGGVQIWNNLARVKFFQTGVKLLD